MEWEIIGSRDQTGINQDPPIFVLSKDYPRIVYEHDCMFPQVNINMQSFAKLETHQTSVIGTKPPEFVCTVCGDAEDCGQKGQHVSSLLRVN